MATKLKVLAIAAATGRVGHVFLIGGTLSDWGMSRKASRSPKLAASQTRKWIDRYQPDVLVTEDILSRTTKGVRTNRIIDAIEKVAESATLLDVSVSRSRVRQNKYEEAMFLATQFPLLQSWVPHKPKIWESEPRSTTLFEALGLAVQVID